MSRYVRYDVLQADITKACWNILAMLLIPVWLPALALFRWECKYTAELETNQGDGDAD